ncbi:signal peptidase I [Nocardioides sp. LML1-1-1.1]|uniref:signal peptidase I n=1 Tax=Nocardioides sp. LML1-1-1.1 TaxID=3135248 RepID=UPI0034166D96
MSHRADRRPWLRTALGVTALVLFFAGVLVVIAALAFSVKVSGHSMEPTLSEGDRLLVNPFASDDVHRFDIVETTLGDREIPLVKRVVGMPGDRIRADASGAAPVVRVRPTGSEREYVVDNPAWEGRVGTKTQPCCATDGTAVQGTTKPDWVRVPEDSYWVVGDNWGGSDDSRTFGFVAADQVEARVSFRLQPFGDFGSLEDDVRLVPATP